MSKSERWQQVKEVLHQALEYAPGGGAAFLAEACAGDELLRGGSGVPPSGIVVDSLDHNSMRSSSISDFNPSG
ncbi:MAG: hypothetical protein ABR568_21240 [Pyrinomonadaceae bacterium]